MRPRLPVWVQVEQLLMRELGLTAEDQDDGNDDEDEEEVRA